ncbi:MAG: hypothetical protein LBP28_09080 [Coriobacteriales bacterium]|nr:hypothetical protein [Coriobacteriales bacterium]
MSTDAGELKNYQVVITAFAERHFIKKFSKKYRRAWDVTLDALKAQSAHIEAMLKNKRIGAPIHATADNQHWILKHSFSVAGRNESPRASGNRAILYVDRDKHQAHIILVYHKSDLGDGDETARWHALVKKGCPELIARFGL